MIFEVVNGGFSYDKKVVFEDINFSIESGDLLAILGPNGIGKTTLIRCMLGFLKWKEGFSSLDNCKIENYKYKKLWNKISYVPQSRNVQTSSLTGIEYIMLGRATEINYFSQPKKKDLNKAQEIMELLGIRDMQNCKMNEISGGQLQLFLIARALISNPKLLVLDEPESNLDFKNQIIVLDILSRLVNNNMGVIFNTHYPTHALQRANKSLLISKNSKSLFGETKTVITEQNLVDAFRVKTSINYIETENKVLANVLPIEVINKRVIKQEKKTIKSENNLKLAVISIIIEDLEKVKIVNNQLEKEDRYIVGKMLMPYENKEISLLNIVCDAPESIIKNLSFSLSQIPNISTKTTYSRV